MTWTRPNRDLRLSTDLFELHVRREFAGERYNAYLHGYNGTIQIGDDYATEAKAKAVAVAYACQEMKRLLEMLS